MITVPRASPVNIWWPSAEKLMAVTAASCVRVQTKMSSSASFSSRFSKPSPSTPPSVGAAFASFFGSSRQKRIAPLAWPLTITGYSTAHSGACSMSQLPVRESVRPNARQGVHVR
jgi:hypothetical protein